MFLYLKQVDKRYLLELCKSFNNDGESVCKALYLTYHKRVSLELFEYIRVNLLCKFKGLN